VGGSRKKITGLKSAAWGSGPYKLSWKPKSINAISQGVGIEKDDKKLR